MWTEEEAKQKWVGRGKKRGHSKGYIRVLCPEHPNAQSDGYIFEHRLVMSNMLGRALLPNEHVHHLDENPSNNDPANLEILSPSEHRLYHSDGIGAHSTRPCCGACGKPIPYSNSTGLCVNHYWESVRNSNEKCAVTDCGARAGGRSGLCLKHVKHRANKRRHNPSWEFDYVYGK